MHGTLHRGSREPARARRPRGAPKGRQVDPKALEEVQALLGEHAWDWRAALNGLQRFILDHLGDPEAILVLDETAELKQGGMTFGEGRQHAGITGQAENCQTVVFMAYVTAHAHALFDFRLYLPRGWCASRERREDSLSSGRSRRRMSSGVSSGSSASI